MIDALVNGKVIEEPTSEISKKKARKLAQSLAFAKYVAEVKHGIALKVATMTIEEAQLRLPEVGSIISAINADLSAFSKGETNIPKMIESGLPPKAWVNRAQQALKYTLLERRLLLVKLQTEKQKKITALTGKEKQNDK